MSSGVQQPTPTPAAEAVDWAANFPAVNSPEWGQMNRRRGALIWREIHATITQAEQAELDALQRLVGDATDRAFSFDEEAHERLRKIEERIRLEGKDVALSSPRRGG